MKRTEWNIQDYLKTPEVFKSHPIIVVYEAGDEIEQMYSKEYSDLVGERYVNRWCYVDDLIKENDHTRKVLDKAKWWLHEIVESHRYTPISTAEMALKEITALEQKEE